LGLIDTIVVDARKTKVVSAQVAYMAISGIQAFLAPACGVWCSLAAEAGYTAFLLVTRKYEAREGCEKLRRCSRCAGCNHNPGTGIVVAKLLGLTLGGLPFLLAPTDGSAAASPIGGTSLATLHPLNLVQLLSPYLPIEQVLREQTRSLYVGAVPLMLVVWLLVRRRELGRLRPLAGMAGLLATVALMMAMKGYFLQSWQGSPAIGRDAYDFSCVATALFQAAIAVLAAIGFVVLESEALETPETHTAPASCPNGGKAVWAVVLASTAVSLAGWIVEQRLLDASLLQIMAGPLLLAAAGGLLIATARRVRGALVLLVLFVAADLCFYCLSPTVCTTLGNHDTIVTSASAAHGDGTRRLP
jgi:hypothetical protein